MNRALYLLVVMVVGVFAFALPQPVRAASNLYDLKKGVTWQVGDWYDQTKKDYNWDGLNKTLDLMKEAGIQSIRLGITVNTQTKCTTWGFYTKLFQAATARGIQVLSTVVIPNHNTTTASADDLQAFSNWMKSLVPCIKNYTNTFEIWSEPNLHYYWNISEDASDSEYKKSVEYYVAYLKEAYAAIKSVHPAATIVGAGLSQYKYQRFVDFEAELGAHNYMDVVGFHPYSDKGADGVIDEVNTFKSYLAKYPSFASKPLFLTEVGFSSIASVYPGNTGGSEVLKATYLSQMYSKLCAAGIRYPTMWYNFDGDSASGNTQGFELMTPNRATLEITKTAAYDAMKNVSPSCTIAVTKTPTPTVKTSATPTIPKMPTATLKPTNVPTTSVAPSIRVTSTQAPTAAACPTHAQGDANCDTKIDLNDFETLRKELVGERATNTADFDRDGKVNLTDYEIWRRAFV